MLGCMPVDLTGALVSLFWILHPLNLDLDPLSACVFVRRLGRYTRTFKFILFFGSCCFWSTFSMCLVGLLSLGYFVPLLRLVLCCVLGSASLGLSSTACSGCPFVSGVLLPLCFPCGPLLGVLRGSFLLLLLFCVSCLVALLVCALGVWGCCGLAPSLLALPPPSPPPWGWSSGAFWSSQCSGPSLRASGCICNGPVVILLVWRVVADWLLSSLLLMATKASALCGLCPLHHVGGVVQVPLAPALEVFALG